jgi:hypothetical protein
MVTRTQVWETDVEKLLEILPDVIGRLVFVSDCSECIVLLSKEGVPEHGVKISGHPLCLNENRSVSMSDCSCQRWRSRSNVLATHIPVMLEKRKLVEVAVVIIGDHEVIQPGLHGGLVFL